MKQIKSKREKILEAAFRVYRESGFTNVRMEDIAKRAGVGKGTMYQYYASKEALLEATIENCILSYTDTLEDIFKSKLSFKASLEKWITFHTYVMSESDGMMEFMHSEGFTLSKALKEKLVSHRQRLYLLMKERINEGVKHQELASDSDPEFIMAMLFGTITHYYVPKGQELSVAKMSAEDFVTQMMNMLKGS